METIDKNQLQGIARILVHGNALSTSDAKHYQILATKNNVSLLQHLVFHRILPSQFLAQIVADHFNLPYIDLALLDANVLPHLSLGTQLLQSHAYIPVSIQDNQLTIATDDPCDQSWLKEIQFHTGYHIHLVIAETDKLHQLIKQSHHKNTSQDLADSFKKSQLLENITSHNERSVNHITMNPHEDAPIITLVNQILLEAVKQGVSDIHFEPNDDNYRIRYRKDGLLSVLATPNMHVSARIVARIKIMASLDISEKRLPQDGRFHFTVTNQTLMHVRVSTCPTIFGEKIVIRLLDPLIAKPNLDALGLNATQKTWVLDTILRPQGMILVTGPTGSGKSMTLYSLLTLLNTDALNICTIEDPVELQLHGINQVNVHLKAGLTFAHALRSFLRQDPDVIMLGEIRDLETADVAIKAALTGHLVLSTLHTNSAAETLSRLCNMGIEPFNIVSAVSLIIAQRLIRLLCEHCKMPRTDLTLHHLSELGLVTDDTPIQIYQARGCINCTQGYQGRIGIFEVLPMSKSIAQLILSGAHADALQKQAKIERITTLYQAGIELVKQGKTTLEEVKRVSVE